MNQIVEKEHAELGPSGWDRWSTCPGSVPLSRGRPNRTSVYAAEGTVAHEIADLCLRENREPHSFIGQTFTVEGHEFEVDDEMAEYVGDYLNTVHQFIPEGSVLLPEQQVPIGHLTGETDAEGTSDCIGIVNGGTRLVVIDLKYGKGVEVNAVDNGQGRLYALGALEKFGLLYEDIAEVEIVIAQPRLDSVSTEILTVEQLREHADEVTMAAGRVELAREYIMPGGYQEGAAVTDGGLDYLNPSEKACRFCPAKAICPALRGEVEQAMAQVSSADDFPDLALPKKASSIAPPSTYSDEQLAEAFRATDLIENWLKAIGEEMHARLLNGAQIPGFYIGVGKAGHRKWGDAEVAERELKSRFKVDEMYVKKVISPTQAEKLMKDKPRVWAKVVEAAGVLQPEGKPKVCREGVDKNRPYELPSAEDFPDLASEESEAQALLS